jgi:cytochrome c oxidase accessory protein FixG
MSQALKDIKVRSENLPTANASLYAAGEKIYPRDVRGRFTRWRQLFVIATQLVYFGLPWINWQGQQALWFDMENFRLYCFGQTFWPQDFVYLSALLICSAFGLFLWTAVAGRLWCGYACPQTVYSEIMLWIERRVEGDRKARIQLDQQAMNGRKFAIKSLKHGLMLLFSLITGVTFVSYFTPMRTLIAAAPSLNYGPWEIFWILFYGGFTYLFAAHLREQVCKYMCPYARFQGVMFDPDSLIISYNGARGEPRAARNLAEDRQALGHGDCVNCGLCVQVCPVGIDIRAGLQYECIGCAACIDACDEVMDKMHYPRGLIGYTSENIQQGKYSASQIKRRILRPRVLLYVLALGAALGITLGAYAMRLPFRVELMRDRSALVRETADGLLENTYLFKVMNVSSHDQHFRIAAQGLHGLALAADESVLTVKAGQMRLQGVRLRAAPQDAGPGGHPVVFTVRLLEDPSAQVQETSSFIGE